MTIKYKLPKINRIPFLLAFILFLSSLISLISPSLSFAATNDFSKTSASITPESQSISASYYTILSGCFWHSIINTSTGLIVDKDSNPDPSTWFTYGENTVYMDGSKSSSTCVSIAAAAVKLWGWTTYASFLSDVGCPHKDFQYVCNSDGATRSNNFRLAVLKQAYPDLYNTAVGNGNKAPDEISLVNAALYIRYINTFANQCSPIDKGVMIELATSDPYNIWAYNR